MSSADSINRSLSSSDGVFVVAPALPLDAQLTAEECLAASESLFDHVMSAEEAAFVERQGAAPFAPLTPDQTRILRHDTVAGTSSVLFVTKKIGMARVKLIYPKIQGSRDAPLKRCIAFE